MTVTRARSPLTYGYCDCRLYFRGDAWAGRRVWLTDCGTWSRSGVFQARNIEYLDYIYGR